MLELRYLEVVEQDDIIAEAEEEEEEMEEDEGKSKGASSELPLLTATEELPSRAKPKKMAVLKPKTRRRSMAQLSSGIGIGDIPIPDSVAGMVLTRIDHMTPSEQMTLKCAAVVGTSFNREMLEVVVPNCNPATFHRSLNTLAEFGIIECSVAAEVRNMYTDLHTRLGHHAPADNDHLHCPCLHKHSEAHVSHKHGGTSHPPVDECEALQFVHTYVQETAYKLWTESQRRSLHEAAGLYLESQAHKCKNCGGGGFIAGAQKPPPSNKKRVSRSGGPGGRAFVGTANMRNKLRRNTLTSRRGSALSRSSVDSELTASIAELQRVISSQLSSSHLSQTHLPSNMTVPSGAESRAMGMRYESICSAEVVGIDLQDCHCDEVLAQVYPQLVRHWRAAGDMHKTLEYMIEAASAAVSTFNNMEAISLLHEAKHLLEEYGSDLILDIEHARLESLLAQVSSASFLAVG